MSFSPDPGGNFASDAHRRVLANLPLPARSHFDTGEAIEAEEPTDFVALLDRVDPDVHTPVDATDLAEILRDLEADGHAAQSEDGWVMTSAGFEVVTGPIAEEVA